MENKEATLNLKRIYSTAESDGKNYVEMLMPEGWSILIKPNRERYGGYTYPYTFQITLKSPDNTIAIDYFSPRNYIDDHLHNFQDNQIDDYGNLLYRFVTIDDYLDVWANRDLSKFQNPKLNDVINTTYKTEYINSQIEKARKDLADQGCNLEDYYHHKQARIYSYTYNNRNRIRVYAGLIEGKDVSKERPIPIPDNIFHDPFMKDLVHTMYPDARHVRGQNAYYHRIIDERRWNVRQLLTLDCLAEDYDFAYKNIFEPIRKQGVTICDDIWNDFNKVREEKKLVWQKKREEKQEAAWNQRQADEQRRQSNKEFYDNLRKTQQEIHDIQKSSYENTQRTQAKVREMWGDVNQGNTRFVDRDGNEHVVHTYDNYAYKRGDTYVTSDSPLDMPYDFEELKKKKY